MRAYGALAVAILAWGVEYPLMKTSTAELGPLPTGAVMFTVATFLLGIQLWVRGVLKRKNMPDRRTIRCMIAVGSIGFVLNVSALVAMRYTSITNVATLTRTDVLFSLLISAFILREVIQRTAWLAVPVMLAGVCILTGFLNGSTHVNYLGDGLVLFSAFLVALNAFIIQHAAQRTDTSLIGIANTAIMGSMFTLSLFVISPQHAISTLTSAFVHPAPLMLGGLTMLFLMGYYTALQSLPVWTVRLLMLLVPVVATLTGAAWMGASVTLLDWLGMLLVCAGAACVIMTRRTARQVAESITEGSQI